MSNTVRPPEVWLPLDVDETDYVAFDYTEILVPGETLLTPVVSCEAASGEDPAAASKASGSPIVDGAVVKQLMTGVLNDVVYLLRSKAPTSEGRVLVLAGTVAGTRIAP